MKHPQDQRGLDDTATFSDLVDVVNLLDQHSKHPSDTNCLLRNLTSSGHQGWRIEADLAVAVRPLPPASDHLSSKLQSGPQSIHLMTRWGRIGENTDGLVLIVFTTTSPSSIKLPAIVLFQTLEGIYLRQSHPVIDIPEEPIQLSELAPFLVKASAEKEFVLYVTADAQVPIKDLYKLLFALPYPQPEVALASLLAPKTRLPSTRQPPLVEDQSIWCPGGLPEPSKDAEEGNLPQSKITAALSPLREDSQRCLASAVGPAVSGGQVLLAFRIGKTGKVAIQCLVEDTIRDGVFGNCLLDATRSLTFPPPDPPGFVDVHLPLRLLPIGIGKQKPVCK